MMEAIILFPGLLRISIAKWVGLERSCSKNVALNHKASASFQKGREKCES